MKRLRWMSALLACLAAVATGLPAFASETVMALPHAAMAQGSHHCQDCPDCPPDRCAQMVDCTAPCAASMPGLAVAFVELRLDMTVSPPWPSPLATLIGERPPPDPFPPRS